MKKTTYISFVFIAAFNIITAEEEISLTYNLCSSVVKICLLSPDF